MLLGSRTRQQDCIMDGTKVFQADLLIRKNKYNTKNLLLTVCDGRGGHEGGEMASRFVFSTGDMASANTQDFFRKTGCPFLTAEKTNLIPSESQAPAELINSND